MAKKKVKVPKMVAGVKVPKALRKSGIVETMLNNPVGRAVLADALVAAAAAAAAALNRHRPSGEQVVEAGSAAAGGAKEAAVSVRDVASSAAGAMVEVVGDAARHMLLGDDDRREARHGDNKRYAHLAETGKRKGKDRDKPSKH